MAKAQIDLMGVGGGNGVIETKTLPQGQGPYSYEYTYTSCAAVIFIYNGTFNYAGLFVKNGTDEIIKSISDVTVTKSGNTIEINATSNMWGNTLYVLHD